MRENVCVQRERGRESEREKKGERDRGHTNTHTQGERERDPGLDAVGVGRIDRLLQRRLTVEYEAFIIYIYIYIHIYMFIYIYSTVSTRRSIRSRGALTTSQQTLISQITRTASP